MEHWMDRAALLSRERFLLNRKYRSDALGLTLNVKPLPGAFTNCIVAVEQRDSAFFASWIKNNAFVVRIYERFRRDCHLQLV